MMQHVLSNLHCPCNKPWVVSTDLPEEFWRIYWLDGNMLISSVVEQRLEAEKVATSKTGARVDEYDPAASLLALIHGRKMELAWHDVHSPD